MRFLMLVKANAESESGALPSPQLVAEMCRFNEEMRKAGALLAAEGLQASSKGARVHYKKGKLTVVDGPFTESKELIAGLWLFQAKSMAEAVEWAKRVPFEAGEVEIRPLMEIEEIPVDPAEKPDGWRDKGIELREASAPARRPGTRRYMGLVMADPDSEVGTLPNEKLMADMGAFFQKGLDAGVILSGEGLQPTSKAKRVRYAGKQRMVIDGPFTESKEIIAGYWLLQFRSKSEAVDFTKRFLEIDAPGRRLDECFSEIRPLIEAEDFAAGRAH